MALDVLSKTLRLPAHYKHMSMEEMHERIHKVRATLGEELVIPAHHYQKEEVMPFADKTGDSLALAQWSSTVDASWIVFCGVHFMAETTDILTKDNQKVLLPDERAGCSMADMANHYQLSRSWEYLQKRFGDTIIPLTYVNSTAAIKAFCGDHGGATLTSSNARKVMEWAYSKKKRILFLPDQHLGRNTAFDMGIPLTKMGMWDPITDTLKSELAGNEEDLVLLLWKGHCSVHQGFTTAQIATLREETPDVRIIVHPECPFDVVQAADVSGSTAAIIKEIEASPPGSKWAVGTEMNLVNRLKAQHPDKEVTSLNPHMCPCLTMNRIDLQHLTWSIEQIALGQPVNQIKVDQQTASSARRAIDRMFQLA
ncbi:quinolinate synthase NadA [Aureibacillus halotolerans]|uniref:Quinolinate synthase n=1 Tax=Aureibacillus halotolerans TaxID=1508390 RepID=A0A4R6U8R0_9BACI|nr:quinolinate synthase NadA [Aureibacillus halotolerans]TDQ42791.1 quinolinate synthetase [Aureibacillus halotolerans]